MRNKKNGYKPKFDENDFHDVYTADFVEEVHEVRSPDGVTVRTETVRKPVQKAISREEFTNKGLTADLFTVENQLAVGNNLFMKQPNTAPFITPDVYDNGVLDAVMDAANDSLFSSDSAVLPTT